VISRLEQTTYGKLTIQTLIDLAMAFGTGLQVRFASFGRVLLDRQDVGEKALFSTPYEEDAILRELARGASGETFQQAAVGDFGPGGIGQRIAAPSDRPGANVVSFLSDAPRTAERKYDGRWNDAPSDEPGAIGA
jgi:hypothetical protein